MSKTKQGRISSEHRPAAKKMISHEEVFGNNREIPPDVKKELDSKGLEGRWLSAKMVYENNGYHKSGWQVYRREKSDILDGAFKAFGDPDGLVRRGDTILGVKTKEMAEKHRSYLRQQADAQSMANVKKRHVEELRNIAKEANEDVNIESDFD